jgi:2OG-Fe(II) oxygenase superfamily
MLKFGHTILRDALPHAYYPSLRSIHDFFQQSHAYKNQYVQQNDLELGYRHLHHKEMFFIRDHHLPSELLPCAELLTQLHQLSLECLKIIAQELAWPEKSLIEIVDTESLCKEKLASSILRLIYYHASDKQLQHACQIHQDLGLLTLICPTHVPALEIYDFVEDRGWLDIELLQGADDVIVMAGESLSLISNGYFLPATHRVRVPEKPRLSIFYQLRFKHDAVIESHQFETSVTGGFAKPFCLTGAEFLKNEINMRSSVNGSY